MRKSPAVALTAALLLGTAAPASADTDRDGCFFIATRHGQTHIERIESTQGCGPSGTYHVNITGAGFERNYPDFRYGGGDLYGGHHVGRSFRSGDVICATLWYHKGGGHYEAWGRPCVTV